MQILCYTADTERAVGFRMPNNRNQKVAIITLITVVVLSLAAVFLILSIS